MSGSTGRGGPAGAAFGIPQRRVGAGLTFLRAVTTCRQVCTRTASAHESQELAAVTWGYLFGAEQTITASIAETTSLTLSPATCRAISASCTEIASVSATCAALRGIQATPATSAEIDAVTTARRSLLALVDVQVDLDVELDEESALSVDIVAQCLVDVTASKARAVSGDVGIDVRSDHARIEVLRDTVAIEVDMSDFFEGGTPRLVLTCRDYANVLTDPTTLAVTVTGPDGVVATFAIGDLTKDSTGIYRAPGFAVPTKGFYSVKVVATGALADVNYKRFSVSEGLPPP